MKTIGQKLTSLFGAFTFCILAAPEAMGAHLAVIADTPVSFRATFTGLDTDATTIGYNDYQVFTCDFWTVLVNLRADGVDGSGNAFGFYEINLTHTGHKVANATAPVVKTFLFYGGLQPGVVLTDSTISSQPHQLGSEYLSTTVNLSFDALGGTATFSGSISGDSDLNGDTVMDAEVTDAVVQTLKTLKDGGIITGKEMGQIIKQTKQPIK